MTLVHKTKKEGKKHKTKHKMKRKTQKKQQIFRIKLRNDRFRMFGPHSKPISAILTWFKAYFHHFSQFRLSADTIQFDGYDLILAESTLFSPNRPSLARINMNWNRVGENLKIIIIIIIIIRRGTDVWVAVSVAAPRIEL